MRLVALSILAALIAGLCVAVAPTPASAGGNPALCIAIQQNLNHCMAQQRRQQYWQDDDDDAPWERRRRGVDCNPWLYEMQANHCI